MPWTTKLTQSLVLTDGTNLVTFKDTIETLMNHFVGNVHSGAIDQVIALLVRAERTKKPADIAAVTREMESLLRARRLIVEVLK
jgi:hypothetical protein